MLSPESHFGMRGSGLLVGWGGGGMVLGGGGGKKTDGASRLGSESTPGWNRRRARRVDVNTA
jgi:hypothetical protein